MIEGASNVRPKIIGARIQRLEDPRFLTGNSSFVDDKRIPDTVHVAFRRSEHSHARIINIDTVAALQMSGVVGVFTAADIASMTKPIRATSRMKDYHSTEFVPLAAEKVRYVGEPIAAVVAQSRYIAEDALEQIDIEFDPLPYVVDPELALDNAAPLLHDEAGTNVLVSRAFTRGDVDAAMASAAVKVGGRFRFRRKTPAALENRSYLAVFDPGKQALTLYSSTQVPGLVRDALADILDMPGHRLRVVAPDVGGGFGGKASVYPEEVVVCVLARKLGRAVKWTSDRMEDLMSTSQAFDEIVDAELAVGADGELLGLKADVIGDVGAYSIYPWTASLEPVQVVSFLPGPYRLSNYSGRVRGVATSKPPMGPYRGVGRPISTFVMERLIDMAARKLAIDPKEMRARNLVKTEEFPYKIASGIVWDRSGFQECLEAACKKINYAGFRAEQAEARKAGRWLGIGIASYAELTGIGSRISAAPGMPINTGTETATIRIDATGAVRAVFGIASHGQGLETSLAQIVAEELGVRIEDIEIVQGDSAAVAHSTGTYASRSAVLAGGAATLTARDLREKVVQTASHLFEASAADIEVEDGIISVVGTDKTMSFREFAKAFYSQMGSLPKGVRETLDLEASKLYDPFFGTTTSATHIAVVEIDPETYGVEVRRYVVAEDCGRIINPLIVEGQVHGGVAQGIGAALLEKVVHDESGQILTASFVDYVVPSAAEIPELEVVHIESESPSTLGGYRGMGEGGTIGAPAAIANALADALSPLGIEINELPATTECLFRLIEKAKANEKGTIG
ncbi:MAG: xanthine dehydrogenase family protein molybdopterin-binding subunit [Alphaproteobacteria bacterium]|nr:xanthine dehydrogenase family protein molybdopterin-binding subunit [Alphaproteobacteria bacterium]